MEPILYKHIEQQLLKSKKGKLRFTRPDDLASQLINKMTLKIPQLDIIIN